MPLIIALNVAWMLIAIPLLLLGGYLGAMILFSHHEKLSKARYQH